MDSSVSRRVGRGTVACTPIYPRLYVESGVDVLPRVGRWSKGTGSLALSLLRRTVPLPLCEIIRGPRTETRMRWCMHINQPQLREYLPSLDQSFVNVFDQVLHE